MFVDHTGHFLLENEEWLRGIGRACAPIFLFLVGFAPHYKFDKELLMLALLLTLCDWLVKGAPNTLNILVTIMLIRLIFGWLESHEKLALKLHEWVIGSIAMIASIVAVQYGSLGLLFALSGYVYKHATSYGSRTPERFLIVVTLLYALITGVFSEFSLLTNIVMIATFGIMVTTLRWFVHAPKMALAYPAPLALIGAWCSRHTAGIYVAHLIVLITLTGKSL